MFGICAPGRDVARLTYFALYALQHRGQESAGIATSQRGHIMAMRDQGLVNQVFDEQRLRALQGDMAVGHVRYSTTGANSWENSQPVWRADRREVALAHNGNLINAVELHGELREPGRHVPVDVGLGDHRRAAVDPPGRHDRGGRGRRDDARRGRVLDRGHDQGPRRRVPRPAGAAAAVARACSSDRYCVASETLRVRHHRRAASCGTSQPGEIVSLTPEGAADADGRGRRAARAVRVRAHLLRAARLAARRPGAPGRARADGRDPRATRRRPSPTS